MRLTLILSVFQEDFHYPQLRYYNNKALYLHLNEISFELSNFEIFLLMDLLILICIQNFHNHFLLEMI